MAENRPELHEHDGVMYKHDKAVCPFSGSTCRGALCPLAIRIKDKQGFRDYPEGYRCGMCGNLRENEWIGERYTSFDAEGNRWE